MIKPGSIIKWLEREFDRFEHSNDDIRVDCPFCPKPDTKRHLYVSVRKPVAHCFRCDWSGTHFQLVREVSGAESYAEVLCQLQGAGSRANLYDFQPVADRLKTVFMEERSRPKISSDMPDWFMPYNRMEYVINPHANLVLKYALKRLTVNSIIWHDIGYCQNPDEMAWVYRVIFPIENGFWQGRAIGNVARAKYLSPPMEKGDVLFNYSALQRHPELFVAEGIISALALGPNSVAIIGKHATDGQAKRIANSRVEQVTIAFDAGTEFSKGVTELADVLVGHGKEVVIRSYAEGDPDSCDVYTEKLYDLKYKVFGGLFK